MAKTNKSVSKRLKVTRLGKILRRSGGQNHFNAKTRRAKQLSLRRIKTFPAAQDLINKYLPNR